MKSVIVIASLFVIFPNILNFRERRAFSDALRLEKAYNRYVADSLADSVFISAGGDFYKRNSIHRLFFGKKYREVWNEKIGLKVLHIDTLFGGLNGVEIGGSMQTIGLDMRSSTSRIYDLRSVNKDQSKALPKWLRFTYARTIFRDMTSALNPYAALVIPPLAEAAGIHHSNPQLVYVPYDPKMKKKYRDVMAGRMAILEEHAGDSWIADPMFNYAMAFYDTDELLEELRSSTIPVDTALFLKSRLFDILINDWDRHEDQWKWAKVMNGKNLEFEPIPKDRDIAFYDFKGGMLSALTLLFNKKFQSFDSTYKNVAALSHNSRRIDHRFLGEIDSALFISTAEELQLMISDSIIQNSFKEYPPEIYHMLGAKHSRILKLRRDHLPKAAMDFYRSLQD